MGIEKRMRYFEDFSVGETFPLPPIRLHAEEDIDFTRQFEGGFPFAEHRETYGLSPWHVATAVWGKWVDTKTDAGGMVAGMSIDFAQWARPVMPGEVLRGTVLISRKRVFSSGDAGSVSFQLSVADENQVCVLRMEITGKMLLRTPLPPTTSSTNTSERSVSGMQATLSLWHPAPFSLSEAEIIAFGKAFDDRPIHVDREGAAEGPFGELISSGLHSMARLLGIWRNTLIAEAHFPLSACMPERLSAQWIAPVRANAPIVPFLSLTKKEVSPEGNSSAYFTNHLLDTEGNPLLSCTIQVKEKA